MVEPVQTHNLAFAILPEPPWIFYGAGLVLTLAWLHTPRRRLESVP